MFVNAVFQRSIVLFALYLLLGVSSSDAQATKASPYQLGKVLIDSKVGSASFFDNMFGASDAVRILLIEMLQSAERTLSSIEPSPSVAASTCNERRHAVLEFVAVPRTLRASYEGQEDCERYLQTTAHAPILFSDLHFDSLKALSKEFSRIARGSGERGEDLYRRCPGECSPQYRIRVHSKAERGYRVDVAVVCGPARDRDDNNFLLSTAIVWLCSPISPLGSLGDDSPDSLFPSSERGHE